MLMADTIAAISTAVSPAGIGIIRVSGPKAIEVSDLIFKGKRPSSVEPNTIHHGWIEYQGKIYDEVLLSVFKKPNSYTGEDIIEINCHGGVLILKSILDLVLSLGVRAAEPGEFTKRAFLNGRMDLSKAEAVMDIISAKSESAIVSAITHLKGELSDKISKIRGRLLYELALIESALDDPEHYSLEGYGEKLTAVLEAELSELSKLIQTAEKGRYIEEGIKTVILGKPNVGKSSFLNMITGRDSAIVTDTPGTTRDVISETVNFGEFALKILDTAGIHEPEDEVEKIGIKRAWEKADEADLIIYVMDGSKEIDDLDVQILKSLSDKKGILLLNKADLEIVISKDDVGKITAFPVVETSAKEGTGEDEVLSLIKEMFFNGEISFNDEVFITNSRHKTLVESAINNLNLVKNSIDAGLPEDFFSIDLCGAINDLDAIVGGNLSDDLVDEIFSKFCMGK